MKNKHGWIRIVEALVAILLIIGFVLLIIEGSSVKKDVSSRIYLTENAILTEIQLNSTFRDYILDVSVPLEFENFEQDLKNHITNRLPEYLECDAKICAASNVCINEILEEDVYVRSLMIAGDADVYNPKQLKLFCTVI